MIPLRKKIGYGLGDMGLSISYFTVGFFFIYYLTDIVGLKPYLAGLAYFIGQAWNSINYPLIGVLSDRSFSRYGRKRVYLLFGAFPFALSFILMWMIPPDGSQLLKFGFATVAILVYTTLYSLVLVPYTSLVPVMTSNYDERTQIIGIRTILSTLGTILGAGAAILVSSFDSELTGLRVTVFTFAVWMLLTVLAAAHSTRGMEQTTQAKAISTAGGWECYFHLLCDRNVTILMLFKFLGAISTASLMAALPYFSKYILGDEGRSTMGLAFYIAVSAIFFRVWERLARRYDKRRLLLVAMLGMGLILFTIGKFVTGATITVFYLGCIMLGTVMSAYTLIAYSFPPDLVDYYDHKKQERHEAIIFGLWQTVHQLGVAFSGLLLGLFLQFFGYDGTQVVQTPSALMTVRFALGLLPGTFMLLAVLALQPYTITRKAYLDIQEDLKRRNFLEKDIQDERIGA